MLKANNLTKTFGSLEAVGGVSLELGLKEAEQVFIVGPNGAGKSTLINLLTGRLTPDTGSVYLDDEDITTLSPQDRVRKGLVRSFQLVHIFDAMTVRENLRTAIHARKGTSSKMLTNEAAFEDVEREIDELITQFSLPEDENTSADSISHGNRKLLDVAITFALDPKYLLLDEPTSGVGQKEKTELIQTVIAASKKHNISTITIEHDMEIVTEYADRLIALNQGEILAEGEADLLKTDDQLRKILLGIKDD